MLFTERKALSVAMPEDAAAFAIEHSLPSPLPEGEVGASSARLRASSTHCGAPGEGYGLTRVRDPLTPALSPTGRGSRTVRVGKLHPTQAALSSPSSSRAA